MGLLVPGITACGDSPCQEYVGCSLAPIEIDFVDEDGAPVLARGTFRDGNRPYDVPTEFDCTGESSNVDVECDNGTVALESVAVRPSLKLQVRFDQEDGFSTGWYDVPLTLTVFLIHNQRDEGCDYPCYTAVASPVRVPASARPSENN